VLIKFLRPLRLAECQTLLLLLLLAPRHGCMLCPAPSSV